MKLLSVSLFILLFSCNEAAIDKTNKFTTFNSITSVSTTKGIQVKKIKEPLGEEKFVVLCIQDEEIDNQTRYDELIKLKDYIVLRDNSVPVSPGEFYEVEIEKIDLAIDNLLEHAIDGGCPENLILSDF